MYRILERELEVVPHHVRRAGRVFPISLLGVSTLRPQSCPYVTLTRTFLLPHPGRRQLRQQAWRSRRPGHGRVRERT